MSVMHWTDKVHRLLTERRWSVEDLAKEAGFASGQTLRNAVNQRTNIGVSSGVRIAQALGVDMCWLFDGDDDGPARPAVRVTGDPSLDTLRLLWDVLEAIEARGERDGSPEAAATESIRRAGRPRKRDSVRPSRGRPPRRA